MRKLRLIAATAAVLLVFAPGPNFSASTTQNTTETYKQLNLFGDVFEQVRKSYVDDVGDDTLVEGAINGMLTSLDPHSNYLNAKSFNDMKVQTRGEFGGLGIEVSMENGLVKVVSPIDDTPAARAGLKPGDLITHLNGDAVQGLSLQEAVEKMRGPINSELSLTIRREGREPFDVKLQRAMIKIQSVRSHLEGNNIGYVRVTSFNEQTDVGLTNAVKNLKQQANNKLIGIVLDLRNNPGGLLDQAVAVSDLFLNSGRIVSTHGRNPDSHQYFEATPGDALNGLPIAVLVNGNSASASEIVAAALQDNDRAVVIGSNSYGKGTVQELRRLPNDGELALTWARFHAPSGYTLHHLGVLPSICTNKDDEDATQLLADLGAGKLPPLPVEQRNATSPDDTAGLDKIRSACPVYHSERTVDLQVALRLLTQPRLYARAVALAEPIGKASATLPDLSLTPP